MREEIENPMINFDEPVDKVVAECEECFAALSSDEEFIQSGDGYFCDGECFFNYHDAKFINGSEIVD